MIKDGLIPSTIIITLAMVPIITIVAVIASCTRAALSCRREASPARRRRSAGRGRSARRGRSAMMIDRDAVANILITPVLFAGRARSACWCAPRTHERVAGTS